MSFEKAASLFWLFSATTLLAFNDAGDLADENNAAGVLADESNGASDLADENNAAGDLADENVSVDDSATLLERWVLLGSSPKKLWC